MGYVAMDCWCRIKITNLPSSSPYLHLSGRKYEHPYFQNVIPIKSVTRFKANKTICASKSSSKKLRKSKELQKNVNPLLVEGSPDENSGIVDNSSPTDSVDNLEIRDSISIASRSSVLQACTVTSGVIALGGVILRQGSHLASLQGWPINDCSYEISFDFEIWHLQLGAGLVILISCSRFLLLKTWSDFAESSEASNQQVLTSLEPLDYALVAFLPGISEGHICWACLWLRNDLVL